MYVVSLFILWGSVRASAMPMAGDGRYPSTGIYNAKSVLQYRHDGTPVPNAGYRNRYWNVFCHLARKKTLFLVANQRRFTLYIQKHCL